MPYIISILALVVATVAFLGVSYIYRITLPALLNTKEYLERVERELKKLR